MTYLVTGMASPRSRAEAEQVIDYLTEYAHYHYGSKGYTFRVVTSKKPTGVAARYIACYPIPSGTAADDFSIIAKAIFSTLHKQVYL